MKTLFAAVLTASTLVVAISACAAETNYDYTISWKAADTNAVPLANVPPILYKAVRPPSVTNVLVACKLAARDKGAAPGKWLEFNLYPEPSVSGRAGELNIRTNLQMYAWALAFDYRGTGTIQVALFESKGPRESDYEYKPAARGRQMSDWINALVKISE
jgi:hypothetical protein